LDRVEGDVPGSRHDRRAPVEALTARRQHLLREDRGAVPGRLLAHERSTPVESLTGEHSRLVAVREALVLTEQVADLACSHTDVTRGDIGVLTDVAMQLGHERLAEAHDLAVGL